MKLISRLLVALLLIGILLPSPAGVSARKRIFKAQFTSTSETHEVLQGNARGSSLIRFMDDGRIYVDVIVRNLTGPATGIHLHAPALEGEDAPVLISLCGPAPSAFGACPAPDSSGVVTLTGEMSATVFNMFNVRIRDFAQYLNDGTLYINAHTDLNPMGEGRGQYTRILP